MKKDRNVLESILWTAMQGDSILANKCLLILYKHQTDHEQATKATHLINDQGFNTADAHILTMYAELITHGVTLTPQQHIAMVQRLLKYCKQLINYEEIASYIR